MAGLVSIRITHGLSRRLGVVFALAGMAGLCPVVSVRAHALERVNLRNGFSYDCTRSESVANDRVRLFLAAGSQADPANFIDLAAQEIVSVELLPDPPRLDTAVAAEQPTPATTGVRDLLAQAGAQHNLDVELLASVVETESGGRARAISPAGARGLMQLMPATAQELGVGDAFRPDQNIAGGAAYLDALLTRYGNNLSLALAAYNAGPAAVDRYRGIPPFRETRAYVARVETEFKRRKLAIEKAAPKFR